MEKLRHSDSLVRVCGENYYAFGTANNGGRPLGSVVLPVPFCCRDGAVETLRVFSIEPLVSILSVSGVAQNGADTTLQCSFTSSMSCCWV